MESSHQGKSKQPSTQPQASSTSAASSTAAAPGTSTSPVLQHQNGSSSTSTGAASNGAKFRRSTTTPSSTLSAPASSNPWSQQQQYRFNSTLPLRILVLKDLVGAIIGRGGNTIKQITQETHARVDVHRKESSTANENVIMIYGNPENCSQACRRILEVMQQEARSLNRPEDFVLKILASNNLIGRIIGKGGSTIKRVMQQTETKITVSSANLASQMNLERIISITGSLENMCKAEGLITQKLRQCFESDMYQYQQSLIYASLPTSMPPVPMGHPGAAGPLNALSGGYGTAGGHPAQTSLPYSLGAASPSLAARGAVLAAQHGNAPSTSGAGGPAGHHLHHSLPSPTAPPPAAFYGGYTVPYIGYPTAGPSSAATAMAAYSSAPPPGASYMSMGAGGYMHPATIASVDNVKETSTVYIPNTVVGAIIGRGGQSIRDMITNSGASIKVAQQSESEDPLASSPSPTASSSSQDSGKSIERRVTIVGTANSQYQAQFFVFQKVLSELYNQAASSSSTSPPVGLYGDPAILKVEILVPTNIVRRIIGKNGSVIQELQRTTGTTIKLSKDTQHHHSTAATVAGSGSASASTAAAAAPPNGASDAEKGASDRKSSTGGVTPDDMTAVHIIGEFTSNFYAQRQIRLIVMRSTSGPPSSQQSPQLVHTSRISGKQSTGASASGKSTAAAKSPTSETSDKPKSVKATAAAASTTAAEETTTTADTARVASSEPSTTESKATVEPPPPPPSTTSSS